MAKKSKMMKFAVPAALALGKRAITHWPLLAAGVGGLLLSRMFSGSTRSLSLKRAKTWAATGASAANGDSDDIPSWKSTTEAWSPTAPTGA
jgi:hypothetical protein